MAVRDNRLERVEDVEDLPLELVLQQDDHEMPAKDPDCAALVRRPALHMTRFG